MGLVNFRWIFFPWRMSTKRDRLRYPVNIRRAKSDTRHIHGQTVIDAERIHRDHLVAVEEAKSVVYPQWNSQMACESVTGTLGKNSQSSLTVDEALRDFVHGAVATHGKYAEK